MMPDHCDDDLDLLLSLQDRVVETPPSSPSAAHPRSPGYLSDDELSKRNRDADMSVFKDAVQDCMDYDVEKARNAFKSNSSKKGSDEPGIEKFSGLKIRNRSVSHLELSNHFADIRFIRLSALKNLITGESFMGCWATIGVLIEKGTPKTSSIGQSYCFWKIGSLDEQTTSIFLFGDAYERHCKEPVATVFAFFNAAVRKDTSGVGFSLSASAADQILKIGTSVDYGVCKGKRKDGMPCTMGINKRHGMYCNYHRSQTSDKYSAVSRTELQGGNLKTGFRDPLKRKGIYMVNPHSERTDTKFKKPMKVLSVEGLKKALSNSVNVTTNIHSQGIRFLTQITGNLDRTKKNESAIQSQKTNSSSVKRPTPTTKPESSAVHRNLPGNKRVKTDTKQQSSVKNKPNMTKMIELELISSDEES